MRVEVDMDESLVRVSGVVIVAELMLMLIFDNVAAAFRLKHQGLSKDQNRHRHDQSEEIV